MISIRRQALIANGLLTLCAGLLALVPVSREAGQVLTMLMGCSLIFSGLADYCGWERILGWFFGFSCFRILALGNVRKWTIPTGRRDLGGWPGGREERIHGGF